ncbi:7338_t:CDS:2, partial [Racocetra fulgida]
IHQIERINGKEKKTIELLEAKVAALEKKVNGQKVEPKVKKGLKKSTPSYYDCLADCSRKGLCGKITKCTHHCKIKAPELAVRRDQEVQKFVSAYAQMGESAKNLFGFFFGNDSKNNGKVK